jgi:hypothetical protein
MCLFSICAPAAPAQGAEADIAAIRTRFTTINRELPRYTGVAKEIDAYAVEGATMTAYFAGPSIRKLVMRYRAESGYTVEEYYFWRDTLFFVYRMKRRANQLQPELEGTDENRFYFANGQLRRWLDERGRQLVVDQPDAVYERREVLKRADELCSIAHTARAAQGGAVGREAVKLPLAIVQTATGRLRVAEKHEQTLRAQGCEACRVWVAGEANVNLYVLDPRLVDNVEPRDPSPYEWLDVGFAKVLYLTRRGMVHRSFQKP